MASISPPHDAADRRSGGKILRLRRTAAPRTPYDRPPPSLPNSAPQNPNWLSKLILSPTRLIATGAGKVLSVFRLESSSSSSYDDSTSEGDSDDANDDTGVSSQEYANQLEKFDTYGKNPQAIEWNSETKRAIERLLMQETFSREECDWLTHIIKSRVVDPPLAGGIDGSLSDIHNRTFSSDVDMRDRCSAAVTEAKKWLEVKKLGSNTKPQLEYRACNLNSSVSPHVTEGEIGSPVDLAKSYMRERLPWSSPSMKDIQLKSPSFTGTRLFSESRHSVSASKLIRDSPSTGPWNITEEIRKVRSKATEDMLRTRPLLITDLSTLASDNKRSPRLLVADKAESVSQIAQDRLPNRASPMDPGPSNSQQSQDLVAVRITEEVEALRACSEGRLNHRERLQPPEVTKAESQSGNTAAADGAKDTGSVGQPLNSTAGEDSRGRNSLKFQDPGLQNINYSTLVEVTVADGPVAANGSLHAGHEKSKLSSDHNKHVDSVHDNNKNSVPLSEFITEVPVVNDSDLEVTVSQSSSSMQHEVVSEEKTLPLKRKAVKINEAGRQRYVRKAKGRLK